MVKLNPIQVKVQKIEKKFYLNLPDPVAELFGMHEGDIVQFLPEKVSPDETIFEKIGSPKLNRPLVDPKDRRGCSEDVKKTVLQKLRDMGLDVKRIGRGRTSIYDLGSVCRIYIKNSKYHKPTNPYFFGLDPAVIQKFNNDINLRFFIVFVAGNENNVYIFPWEDFKKWLTGVSPAHKDNNFKITYTPDLKLHLTGKNPIDVSKYLNNFELFDCK